MRFSSRAALFLAALLLTPAFARPAAAQGPDWGQRWEYSAPPSAGPLAIPDAPAPQVPTVLPAQPFPPGRVPAARPPVAPAGREKTFYYTSEPGQRAGVERTALQRMPGLPPRMPADEAMDYTVRLEVPGLQRLTQLESEAQLKERMRQEARAKNERLNFPEEPVLSKESFVGRHWTPLTRLVEPNYLCYQRLLFQQKNFERYGWDLGPITPLLSAGKFFVDVVSVPYNLGTRPLQQYECNTGYCLPGDPVPLLLYPPEISATGLLAEAAVVTGLFFIFP